MGWEEFQENFVPERAFGYNASMTRRFTLTTFVLISLVSHAAGAAQMYWVEKSLNTIQVPNQYGGYSTIQLPVQRQPITGDEYYGPHSEIPQCTDTAGHTLPDEECEYMEKHGY